MLALALACATDPKTHPQTTDSQVTPTTPSVDSGTPTQITSTVPVASGLTWTLNPNVGSVVVAAWHQDVPGYAHVEYSFDQDDAHQDVWESSPAFDATVGPQTQVLVGIPFAMTAKWRVVVDTAAAIDGPDLTTGPVPDGFLVPRLVSSDPTKYLASGKFLLTSINAKRGAWVGGYYWTFILDRLGRPVWAHLAPNSHWTLFAQVSAAGDTLLWDESTAWSDFDDGAGSKVHETWLDGEEDIVATPGLHHAFVQLPDGTFAWGSLDHASTEALVEKAPGQTDETILWTCGTDWPHSGRCESNGLFYDALTDTYLYSFYTNSSVVQVARSGDTTGTTPGSSLWWAGDVKGGYTFDPPASQFYWQHGISFTDARTLLVSSKNNGRTWLLEYSIDDATKTLHMVWNSNSHAYAEDNGAAWRLSNGDTLHIVGTSGVVREVDPDGDDVWRLTWDGQHNLGEGQLLDDLYKLIKPRAETSGTGG